MLAISIFLEKRLKFADNFPRVNLVRLRIALTDVEHFLVKDSDALHSKSVFFRRTYAPPE